MWMSFDLGLSVAVFAMVFSTAMVVCLTAGMALRVSSCRSCKRLFRRGGPAESWPASFWCKECRVGMAFEEAATGVKSQETMENELMEEVNEEIAQAKRHVEQCLKDLDDTLKSVKPL